MRRQRPRLFTAGLVLALAGTACSSGGGEADATPSASSSDEVVDDVAGAVGSFQDVQSAAIQIIAQGTFRDPELGYADASGAGSGFIISPDGLAVTNNHVVAGAATLEVFVGGDDTKSYNATILGVSECNDLALIDINESEPLPFLAWYQDEIQPGLEVYAAGFPLGDPEFTLTKGIVSKAKAGGDLTGTSSIDHTIEHDANIQPGNSGGPLVDTDGRVVAINYAGGAVATTTAQFFGIASDLAQPVIERLKGGDFESLGLNGWATYDDAQGIAGIWVAGVAAGSPAANAQILPGDIITSMNGLPVGTDGTFKDYCDVIRTAGSNAIAVEVLRYDTSEVLRGEINGEQPIELAFSFADDLEQETDLGASTTGGYSGYQEVVDDLGRIIVEVPNEWSDIDPAPAETDGGQIPYIAAAPDLSGFFETYDVPGMLFVVLEPQGAIEDVLAQYAPGEGACTDLGIQDYSDPVFTGAYQTWDSCGGTATALVVLAAAPADESYTAIILAQLVSEDDIEVLDRIFATFNVIT